MSLIKLFVESISQAKENAIQDRIYTNLTDLMDRYAMKAIYKDIADKKLKEYSRVFYRWFKDYDPTPNGKYLNWIADKYVVDYREPLLKHFSQGISGSLRVITEDASKHNRNLKMFHLLKDRKMVTGREADINSYDSLDALYQFVKPHLSNPDLLGTKKEVIMKESEIIYEEKNITVVVPQSYKASCFWGSGTNWCTAVDDGDDDTFKDYTKGGNDLYIIIIKDSRGDRKFQYHYDGHFQFMDEDDKDALNEFNTIVGTHQLTEIFGLINYHDYKKAPKAIDDFLYDLDGFSSIINEEFGEEIEWVDFLRRDEHAIIKQIYKNIIDDFEGYSKGELYDYRERSLPKLQEVIDLDLYSIVQDVGTSVAIYLITQYRNEDGLRDKLEKTVFNRYEELMK